MITVYLFALLHISNALQCQNVFDTAKNWIDKAQEIYHEAVNDVSDAAEQLGNIADGHINLVTVKKSGSWVGKTGFEAGQSDGCKAGESVSATGYLKLNSNYEALLDVDLTFTPTNNANDKALTNFDVTLAIDGEVTIDGTIEMQAEGIFCRKKDIKKIDFKPRVFYIGDVPVVIRPYAEIQLTAKIDLSGTFTHQYYGKLKKKYRGTIELRNGIIGKSDVSSDSPSTKKIDIYRSSQWSEHELTTTTDISFKSSVAINVRFGIRVYDALNVYFELVPKVHADIATPFDCKPKSMCDYSGHPGFGWQSEAELSIFGELVGAVQVEVDVNKFFNLFGCNTNIPLYKVLDADYHFPISEQPLVIAQHQTCMGSMPENVDWANAIVEAVVKNAPCNGLLALCIGDHWLAASYSHDVLANLYMYTDGIYEQSGWKDIDSNGRNFNKLKQCYLIYDFLDWKDRGWLYLDLVNCYPDGILIERIIANDKYGVIEPNQFRSAEGDDICVEQGDSHGFWLDGSYCINHANSCSHKEECEEISVGFHDNEGHPDGTFHYVHESQHGDHQWWIDVCPHGDAANVKSLNIISEMQHDDNIVIAVIMFGVFLCLIILTIYNCILASKRRNIKYSPISIANSDTEV